MKRCTKLGTCDSKDKDKDEDALKCWKLQRITDAVVIRAEVASYEIIMGELLAELEECHVENDEDEGEAYNLVVRGTAGKFYVMVKRIMPNSNSES